MRVEYTAVTRKGKNKSKNEDRVLINKTIISEGDFIGYTDEPFIALICDGVGGEEGGDIASQIAAEIFCECNKKDMTGSSVVETFLKANQNIHIMQKEMPKYKNMATTIAGLVICKDEVITFNAGDTRIYKTDIFKKTEQISIDHTIAKEKLSTHNIVSMKEASLNDFSTLTKYLGGYGSTAHSYIKIRHADNKDLFVICSDGIYKSIPEKFLYDVLKNDTTIAEKQKAVFSQAQKNGLDDMSMVILKTTY